MRLGEFLERNEAALRRECHAFDSVDLPAVSGVGVRRDEPRRNQRIAKPPLRRENSGRVPKSGALQRGGGSLVGCHREEGIGMVAINRLISGHENLAAPAGGLDCFRGDMGPIRHVVFKIVKNQQMRQTMRHPVLEVPGSGLAVPPSRLPRHFAPTCGRSNQEDPDFTCTPTIRPRSKRRKSLAATSRSVPRSCASLRSGAQPINSNLAQDRAHTGTASRLLFARAHQVTSSPWVGGPQTRRSNVPCPLRRPETSPHQPGCSAPTAQRPRPGNGEPSSPPTRQRPAMSAELRRADRVCGRFPVGMQGLRWIVGRPLPAG